MIAPGGTLSVTTAPMYGANFNFNAGNTVYKWSPTTGQEFINGVAQTAPGGNTIFMGAGASRRV